MLITFCNYPQSDLEYFITQRNSLGTPPSQPQATTNLLGLICLSWIIPVNGILQYVAICAIWLLSLSIIFSMFIHVVASVNYFNPFEGWIIFHCMTAACFVYPFINWWTFGLLPHFARYEQGCYDHSHANLCGNMRFHFSGETPKSGIPDPYGNSVFNCLRKCQAV